MQFKNNFTSNSQIIARGKAECNLTLTCTIILELHENACDCLLIALHDLYDAHSNLRHAGWLFYRAITEYQLLNIAVQLENNCTATNGKIYSSCARAIR